MTILLTTIFIFWTLDIAYPEDSITILTRLADFFSFEVQTA